MHDIYSLNDLITFQQKTLLKLTNSPKFIKLESLFKSKPNIKRFTKFFKFVFTKLKCIINKKLNNISGKNFKINFNLTNDNGVVIFDQDYYIIYKYGNFCTSDKNIVLLFSNISENVKFNNDIQNQLVDKVNNYKIPNKFYEKIYNSITYFSTFTNSTAGGSSVLIVSPINTRSEYCGTCPSGSTLCATRLKTISEDLYACITICTGKTGACNKIYLSSPLPRPPM